MQTDKQHKWRPHFLRSLRGVRSLRAYKLGKKRWSYNQCQLVIQQEGGREQLTVMEAMAHGQSCLDHEHQVLLHAPTLSLLSQGHPHSHRIHFHSFLLLLSHGCRCSNASAIRHILLAEILACSDAQFGRFSSIITTFVRK